MKNTWSILFAIVSVVHLAALLLDASLLTWITKPLLMPALAAWLFFETRGSHFLSRAWLSGLAFSTLGDILLLLRSEGWSEIFFVLGLGAFLLAHIFYIGGLWHILKGKKGFLSQKPIWALPFILYLLVLLAWLWPGVPAGLRWPVGAYGIVITYMAISVLQLRSHISPAVFQQMMAGALLFVLSDSLLAVGKFGHVSTGALPVMITYIGGQALLATGVIRLLKEWK